MISHDGNGSVVKDLGVQYGLRSVVQTLLYFSDIFDALFKWRGDYSIRVSRPSNLKLFGFVL